MSNRGIYLHIPFCASKCAYCNFYSKVSDDTQYDKLVTALCNQINRYKVRFSVGADSLYLGGGTPTVLGGERLSKLITTTKPLLKEDAEITVECNPADNLEETFKMLKDVGVNRLSIGVQSGVLEELKILNRRHTPDDVVRTIETARKIGIDNISLDLMLGIPKQTLESVQESLDFLLSQKPNHISAYILKIEPNTPFGKAEYLPDLPNEDLVSEMYLFCSSYLRQHGFEHYEISNFANPGCRSRHNMKYWEGKEYLGLGPSAYSYFDNRRFHFESDLEKFLKSPNEIFDEIGGTKEEYIMLRLRLSDGLNFEEYRKKFNCDFPEAAIKRAKKLQSIGLVEVTNKKIAPTIKGYLLSNSIILEILGNDFN